MTTINNTFINALLADATYAHDLLPGEAGTELRRDLSTRMTLTLADYISSNFSVVTQVESGDVVGSGFDATVWRKTDGKLFVSMRGTEPPQDLFVADSDLAFTGNARFQIMDMVNWWLRETGADGESVRQIRLGVGPIESTFVEGAAAIGTGRIAAADIVSGIEVNGHSLGGYLASAFSRLFGAQAHVEHVSTFNSAGFAPGSEAVFTALQNLIGPSYGLGRFPNSSEQTNYFAKNGLNLTTNNSWFTQTGNRIELFNESDATQLGNHFMYKLTDALALGNALSQLDSTFTTEKLNTLLAAGSNNTHASIEGLFDALLRVFQGGAIFRTTVGDVDASAETRVNYQSALSALQSTQVFKDLSGKLIFSEAGTGLQASARTNFGALVALQDLSPIVVSGGDPAADALLTTLWQTTRTTDYAAWNADRSLATPSTFTEAWITDRSVLLQAIVARNKQDNTGGLVYDVAAPGDHASVFQWFGADPLQGEVHPGPSTLFFQRQGGAVSKEQRIIFGDDTANILVGTDNQFGDHLYGDAGADTLNGLTGNDYLEGGVGTDTYQFTSGFGQDTIFDSDGLGVITVGSTNLNLSALNGGKETATGSGMWLSADKQYRYTLTPETNGSQTLTIYTPNGSDNIKVRNFQNHQLGINLDGTTVTAPGTTDYTIVGDLTPIDTDPVASGIQAGADALGNVLVDPNQAQVGRADTLYDSTGNDLLQGRDGSDTLLATRGGDDRLEGGNGNDYAEGGAGNDTLLGGTGNDILVGGADDDVLYSNAEIATEAAISNGRSQTGTTLRGDWLNGGTGNDTVIAGADNDVLLGGAGDDLLIGGAGDDVLDGDDDFTAASTSWTVTAAADGNVFDSTFSPIYNNNPLTNFVGGDDVLYGGNGNDRLYGLLGDDLLYGEGGNDIMAGGDGDDILFGGAGNDIMTGDFGRANYSNGAVVVQGDDYLDGGDGNDEMFGEGGNDFLLGGAGNDTLFGDGGGADLTMQGDDTLDGGDGNDLLYGGGGADTLYGGAGNDTLSGDFDNLPANVQGEDLLDGGDGDDTLLGSGGDDTLFGGAGNDNLQGGADDDFLQGDAGNDTLDGGTGNDVLFGGDGADTLQGGSGNDTLQGNAGDDSLNGGLGDDSYIFALGDGHDTLADTSGVNTLRFDTGITPELISFGRTGNDLVLSVGGTTDQLTIKNWGNDANARLASATFGTGITWDTAYITAQALLQPILGTEYGDSLGAWIGESGTTLAGGMGNDSYSVHHTNDIVLENPDEGFDAVTSSADYTLGANVEYLYLSGGAVRGTGNELNNFLVGNDAGNLLAGGAGDDVLLGLNGNDYLTGGTGNDTLQGGAGADTYSFNLGDGQDEIDAADYLLDDIVFGAGITSASVVVSHTREGTLLRYGSVGDSVLITDGAVRGLRFADGLRLTMNDLFAAQAGFSVVGTENGDLLADTSYWARSIDGGSGNDVILGGGSDTTYTLYEGDGEDSIVDLGGVDTLSFGQNISVDDVWFENDFSADTPSFKVHYGSGDVVSIVNGGHGSIEQFRFSDGSVYSFNQLATQQGFVAPAELNIGRNIELDWGNSDRAPQFVVGTAGNDTVIASNEGGDIYVTGKGNDHIVVFDNDGEGRQKIVFNLGDGLDTLDITFISHVALVFGSGIDPNSLRFSNGAGHTYIHYGTQGDRIVLNGLVESFQFADGNQYSYNQMRSLGAWYVAGPSGGGESGNPGVYRFNLGDGVVSITGSSVVVGGHPSSAGTTISKIQFGLGIDASMLTLGKGSLLIRVGNNGDELHLTGFNPDDAYAASQIQQLLFADGSSLSYSALLDKGFDLKGSASGDVISGTNAADRINGLAGNDTLSGGDGDDVLDGGTGNDTYQFGPGDGIDRIYDYDTHANVDTVQFAAPVLPGDVNVHRNGQDLELRLANSDDTLILSNWYTSDAYKIEQVQFADGIVWNTAYLLTLAPPPVSVNLSPIVARQIDAQNASEEEAWSFTLPLGTFSDPDRGDYLTVSAAMAGGAALPAWLRFDSTTQSFSGTPPDTAAGALAITVTAADSAGATVTAGFMLEIANTIHGTDDADTLVGTAGRDVIHGFGGNDVLDGGAGADTMIGGSGDDLYFVDDLDDVVVESSALYTEVDTVRSSVNYSLGANLENLTLTGTAAISGSGNRLGNVLNGNQAGNVLTGDAQDEAGGGEIVNSLVVFARGSPLGGVWPRMEVWVGGVRTQSFNVDSAGYAAYVVTAPLGISASDIDIVFTNDAYAPARGQDRNLYVDRIVVNGRAISASGAGAVLDIGIGAAALDGVITSIGAGVLFANGALHIGLDGNDWLDGGEGADTLLGGYGNDVYVVDNAGDVVRELVGAGHDTVFSSVTYTLPDNVEDLVLTGTLSLGGSGNAGRNTMSGNAGANRLDGAGGADFLAGGQGDDIYVVDNANDTVYETPNAGTDTVESSASFTLGADVENLRLTGSAATNATGNGADNLLDGNDADNMLFGGAGNDTLRGGAGNDKLYGGEGKDLLDGGLGADRMMGGYGDDLYVVDNAADIVVEIAGGGHDVVRSTVSFMLGDNVEDLELIGLAAINGTGNAGNNTLRGNAAANRLDGGAGVDVLAGGGGGDTYVMGRGYGKDRITESDATPGNVDVAFFQKGIAADQLWFRRVSSDLEVSVIGTGDKFTISDWYLGSQYHVEQFQTSNGKTLLDSQVQNLVSAMAAFAPPAAGQTSLSAPYASQLAPVIAANWH